MAVDSLEGVVGIKGNIDLERTVIYDEAFKDARYHPVINLISFGYAFAEDKRLVAEAKAKGLASYVSPDKIIELEERVQELKDKRDIWQDLNGQDSDEVKELENLIAYTLAFKGEAEDLGERIYCAEEGIAKKKANLEAKYAKDQTDEFTRYKKKLEKLEGDKTRDIAHLDAGEQRDLTYLRAQTKRLVNSAKRILWTTAPSVFTSAALYYSFNVNWLISLATGIFMALPAGILLYKREHNKETTIVDEYENRRKTKGNEFETKFRTEDETYKQNKSNLEAELEAKIKNADDMLKASTKEIFEEEVGHMIRQAHMYIPNGVKLAYTNVDVSDLVAMLEKDLDKDNPAPKEEKPAEPTEPKKETV